MEYQQSQHLAMHMLCLQIMLQHAQKLSLTPHQDNIYTFAICQGWESFTLCIKLQQSNMYKYFCSFFLTQSQQVIPSLYEYAKSQHQLMCQQCMQQHWRTINPVPAFCKVNIVHDLLCLIPNSFSLTSEPLCLTLHV